LIPVLVMDCSATRGSLDADAEVTTRVAHLAPVRLAKRDAVLRILGEPA
jgi:hypothetical protein